MIFTALLRFQKHAWVLRKF